MAADITLLKSFVDGQGAGAVNYVDYAPDMDTNFTSIETVINAINAEIAAFSGRNAPLILDMLTSTSPANSTGFIDDNSFAPVAFLSGDTEIQIPPGTALTTIGRVVNGTTDLFTGSGGAGTRFIALQADGTLTQETAAAQGIMDLYSVTWDGAVFTTATLTRLESIMPAGDDFQDQLTVAGDATVPVQTHTRIANRMENTDRVFNGNTVNVVAGGPVLGVIGTPGMASGARLAFATAATITIGTSALQSHVRDTTRVFTMSWTGTLTADITAAGAGGLDTGAEAASTWYAVHVIGDTSRVNATDVMLSLSATAPTLPGTHDVFRRVGWVRNDAGSNLIDFIQFGDDQHRIVKYVDAVSNRQVLTAGAATVVTAVGLAALVPTTSQEAYIHAFQNGTQIADLLNGTAGAILATVQVGNELALSSFPTDTSQNVAYNHPAAGGLLDVCLEGYGDDI